MYLPKSKCTWSQNMHACADRLNVCLPCTKVCDCVQKHGACEASSCMMMSQEAYICCVQQAHASMSGTPAMQAAAHHHWTEQQCRTASHDNMYSDLVAANNDASSTHASLHGLGATACCLQKVTSNSMLPQHAAMLTMVATRHACTHLHMLHVWSRCSHINIGKAYGLK